MILFYLFILLASPRKKTNKQKKTLAGTPQQLWPITAGPDTNKKNKNKKY